MTKVGRIMVEQSLVYQSQHSVAAGSGPVARSGEQQSKELKRTALHRTVRACANGHQSSKLWE